MADRIPALCADLTPPTLFGTAELTHRAFAGAGVAELLAFVDRTPETLEDAAAHALDCSTVHQLAFQAEQALAMQAEALEVCQLYRVAGAFSATAPRPLRLLAVMEPGDLMTNTPLDFITRTLNVRLDLLYLLPGVDLPDSVPDHDVAYIGGGDIGAPAALARRAALYRQWPRPVLNDPWRVAQLARAELARNLAGAPGLCSPECHMVDRAVLLAMPPIQFPVLVRPVGSHAGANLAKVEDTSALHRYLEASDAATFYVTRFIDYRSADGYFRKYRIAFMDGVAMLCHMGVSQNWMIHYLNAGMTEDEDRRADEALAMQDFDAGFAARHHQAFDALSARVGLDYFTIDCAETRDGRLLVFEADAEAIVHAMDPPDLFPYKIPQMRRVFAQFEALLQRHAGGPRLGTALAA